MSTPDPSAATDVPRERARLPVAPSAAPPTATTTQAGRSWVRTRRADADAAGAGEEFQDLDLGAEPEEGRAETPAHLRRLARAHALDVAAAVAAVVGPLEEEPTDHGDAGGSAGERTDSADGLVLRDPSAGKGPDGREPDWRWVDPFKDLPFDERTVCYLARLTELAEYAERRAQAQARDPGLQIALTRAQLQLEGKETCMDLVRRGVDMSLVGVGKIAAARRTKQAAVAGGVVGFLIAASGALLGFVIDHIDLIVALITRAMRGL